MHVTNGTEQRFHHYCYICNTQLNSCKQALLHCNGKRHRKKLYYLQQRRGIGALSTSTTPVVGPTSPGNTGGVKEASSPMSTIIYPTNPGAYTSYPLTPSPGGFGHTPSAPEGRLFTSQTIASNNGTVIYPILIGSPMMPSDVLTAAGQSFPCPPPVPMNFPPPSHPPLPYNFDHRPAIKGGSCRLPNGDSTCSSPLFLTELSYSSAEPASSQSNRTGSRSTIVSPSGTSSASSTEGKPRCDTCLATFATPTQLFAHLRAEKHFRPLNLAKTTGLRIYKTGSTAVVPVSDGESRKPLADNSNLLEQSSGFLYCSVCHIASNSDTGLNERSESPSSSDSAQEGPADSGYLSGASNSEVVRRKDLQTRVI